MSAAGVDVVNLSSGELDFDPPSAALTGGVDAIRSGHTRYAPVAGVDELRAALADLLATRWHAPYPTAQIVVTNGAKQALANALAVLLDPGDEVIVAAPFWVSFPHMIRIAGGTPVICRTDERAGFKLTARAVQDHLTNRTRALIINNPTNPTGATYTPEELAEVAEVAVRHGLVIIADEVYGDLVYEDATFVSVASLGPRVRDRTVTVGGFSKLFAMSGWRVGFAAAPPALVGALRAWQGHTTSAASSVSQYAALAVLRDDPTREFTTRRAELDRRRRLLSQGLAGIPGLRLAVQPRGAFFAFVDVSGMAEPGGRRGCADDVAERLLREARVAVMPGTDFGAADHVRMSYGVPVDRIGEAIDRLHRCLASR
jgi:aspartate aminotransferase